MNCVCRGADKSIARPGRKQVTATEDFDFIYPIYNHKWRNFSTIYTIFTRLALKEIFSPSNKIHRKVGRAKDLSAPLQMNEDPNTHTHMYAVSCLFCCRYNIQNVQRVTSKAILEHVRIYV